MIEESNAKTILPINIKDFMLCSFWHALDYLTWLSLIGMIFPSGSNRSQMWQSRYNRPNTVTIYAVISVAFCILLQLQGLFGVYADSIVKERIVDDIKEISNTHARVRWQDLTT
jgi:hypothetical protein